MQAESGLRPGTRQAPKIDAGVILVSVPCVERVPPLISRLITTGRRLRSAVRLRRIVCWRLRMSHEDEEFPHRVRGRLLMWLLMRRHSLACTADGSSR